MVIKTDSCFYSELKIYPGHGRQYVRRDGKLLTFLNSKCHSLYKQKIAPQKLTWTQQWRRTNKKSQALQVTRRRKRATGKVYKAIQGISIEDINKRRSQKADYRKNMRAASLREIKERKQKSKDTRKKTYKSKKRSTGFVKQPKLRRALNVGARR
mmetsp:Transcript_11937/g.13476  ORF Transcript_11937/g.13476 Transcript_11937/m.13476 type:complete len:155 (-) Transcript_11937:99-563(-)|eukprot:CAMPEP_0205822006 /NCGR_PEP_ID=MMETSP0206-20130828/10762_1 /ASSEMBLY_ACC=CAM_ASM_000279 /TAXON_ID=36767 /ORGANISM="Euplotes focardii, Strain TN1" /LENGTH=154 /DNA_ID=CAMNT_0053117929 /DNA_START=30 /DNA_END=494 /DNA_ORIENTATION=+